jgi:hypothetical protein
MLQVAAAGFGCSSPTGLAYYRQYGECLTFCRLFANRRSAFLRGVALNCAQKAVWRDSGEQRVRANT